MDLNKLIKTETIQNKQQLVVGNSEFDLILKSKGKVGIQVGNKFADLTKLTEQNPWIPRVFPISSADFKRGTYTYNYEIDMRNFDCISCNWKSSNYDSAATEYVINITLLSAYDYKMNTIHLNVINDAGLTTNIPVKIKFLNITGENNFGFEEMPIVVKLADPQKVRSRFLIFYYDPVVKYWFNPLF